VFSFRFSDYIDKIDCLISSKILNLKNINLNRLIEKITNIGLIEVFLNFDVNDTLILESFNPLFYKKNL